MPEFYVPNEARISVDNSAAVLGGSVRVGRESCSAWSGVACSRPDLVETSKDSATGLGNQPPAAGRNAECSRGARNRSLGGGCWWARGLTIRGFLKLQNTELAFNRRGLMVGLPIATQALDYEQRVASRTIVLEGRKIPGVQSGGDRNGGLPFGGTTIAFR